MKRIQILLLVFHICMCMFAQQQQGTHILSDISVFKIMKDHDGLLWLGTNDGLYCYDGSNVLKLPSDARSPLNTVNDILETADGTVVVGMKSGLYVVNQRTASCEHIYKEFSDVNALCLLGDSLYVGCRQGLACIPVANQHSKWVAGTAAAKMMYIEPNMMSHGNNVVDVVPDGNGGCWIGMQTRKILHYHPASGTKKEYLGAVLEAGAELRRLCLVGNKLYLATGNMGLYAFDTKKDTLAHCEAVEANVITDLNTDADGTLYVSTDGDGAFVFDTTTGRTKHRFSTDTVPNDSTGGLVASNAVYTFWHDSENNVNWFGYFMEGCESFSCRRPLFGIYRYRDFDSGLLQTTCYSIHGRDRLIGTRNGLYFVSEDRDIVKHFTPQDLGASIVTDVCFFAGKYVVSCYDCGLSLVNPQTLSVESMTESGLLPKGNFSKLSITPDGKNLIVLSNVGMFLFDDTFKVVKRFTSKNSGLPDSYFPYIKFDSGDKAWISSLKGLAIYDWKDSIIHSTGFPKGFFNDVPDLSFNETLEGDILAIGTDEVYISDVELKTFRTLDIHERMYVGRIAFIYPFEHRYWMATDKGFFVLDSLFRPLCQLNESGNLPSLMFNRQFVECIDDTLWFAHSRGLLYLTAEARSRALNPVRGQVVLSRVVVGGKEDQKAVFSVKNHHLDVGWNFVSETLQVQPHLLSYDRKCTRFYEYSVDGGAWTLWPGDMMIKVNRLLPGNHELKIRLIGNAQASGVYTVRVRPSVQFYMEMIILVFLILSAVMLTRFIRSSTRLSFRRWKEKQRQREVAEIEAKNVAKSEFLKSKDSEYQILLVKVREYMEENKPYKNPELRMTDVAKAVGTNATNLSQMFNLYLHQTFFDFVNSYRMAEFKRLADTMDSSVYTISALSDMCGFKKSSFFSVFKKLEGCTPAQYLKNRKNEAQALSRRM